MAAKTFTGPGNFSDNTKWDSSTLPSAGDTLTIQTGTCTVTADDATVYGAMTINSSITFNLQTYDFSCGALTVNGTLQVGESASGGMTCAGLTVANNAVLNLHLGSLITCSGNVTIGTGQIWTTAATGQLNLTSNCTYNGQQDKRHAWYYLSSAATTTFGRSATLLNENSYGFYVTGTLAVGAYTIWLGSAVESTFDLADVTGSGDIEFRLPNDMSMNWSSNTWSFTGMITFVKEAYNGVVISGDFSNAHVHLRSIYDPTDPAAFDFVPSAGTLKCKSLTDSSIASDLLAEEGFTYVPNGATPTTGLATKRGGKGWSNGWATSVLDAGISENRLTFSKGGYDLYTYGRSSYMQEGYTAWQFGELLRYHDMNQMPAAYVNAGKLGKVGTTLWTSYLCHITKAADTTPMPPSMGWWMGTKPTYGSGWFGRNADAAVYGIESPAKASTVNLKRQQTVLLVMKTVFEAGGAVTSLWVDPTPALDDSVLTPEDAPDITEWNETAYTFDYNYWTSSTECRMAQYRLGPSYFSVAPATVELTGITRMNCSLNNPSFVISGDMLLTPAFTWTKGTGTITFSGGAQAIEIPGLTVEDIVFSGAGTKSIVYNFSTDSLSGTAGTVQSSVSGAQRIITATGKGVCSGMTFKDISLGSAARTGAKATCVNNGNNKGIVFRDVRTNAG